MKKLFLLVGVLLFASSAQSQTKCTLNTSDPRLTQGFIPMHGGSFQGVTGYNNPSEWVELEPQDHWASQTSNGHTFDRGLGLLNMASEHLHAKFCYPYNGQISGPLTVPGRMLAFMFDGTFQFDSGPMITDAQYNSPPVELYGHEFQGNPNGLVQVDFVMTFDPTKGDPSQAGYHGPALNGYSVFSWGLHGTLRLGGHQAATAWAPIFTKLADIPEQTGFGMETANYGSIDNIPTDSDPGVYGSQVVEFRLDKLPLVAPFDFVWPLYHLLGNSYGGRIIGLTLSLREDMDLHGLNGPPSDGRLIHGLSGNNDGIAFLDPVEIGVGKHSIFLIGQVDTGVNGIPGVAGPDEIFASIIKFNVEVGPNPSSNICTIGGSVNFGGSLPCIANEPPPVVIPPPPDWKTISGILQRLNDQIRVCDPIDNKCLVLGTIQ